jgi:hypothetical protein
MLQWKARIVVAMVSLLVVASTGAVAAAGRGFKSAGWSW